jgi:membrane-bound lytic murein transglycosylase B
MIVPAAATALCGGDFGTWLEGLKEEAAAQGVSQSTISRRLDLTKLQRPP